MKAFIIKFKMFEKIHTLALYGYSEQDVIEKARLTKEQVIEVKEIK